MAVHFSTSNPRALLREFDAAVRRGAGRTDDDARAWGVAEDGDHYTCVAEQWVAKAWFKPQVLTNVLTFNIVRSADEFQALWKAHSTAPLPKVDFSKSIEAIGPDPHPEIAPASMTAIYEYGPRGDLPACKLTWYQGTHKPQIWTDKGIPQYASGVLFVGTKGRMLLSDYNKHVLLPEAEFKDFKRPEPFIADGLSQQQEWLLACKNGTPTGSPFNSYAGLLTEANHLGNVAFRAGQKIVWDSAAMKVTNTRAADPFLGRKPREGWSLAGIT